MFLLLKHHLIRKAVTSGSILGYCRIIFLGGGVHTYKYISRENYQNSSQNRLARKAEICQGASSEKWIEEKNLFN